MPIAKRAVQLNTVGPLPTINGTMIQVAKETLLRIEVDEESNENEIAISTQYCASIARVQNTGINQSSPVKSQRRKILLTI